MKGKCITVHHNAYDDVNNNQYISNALNHCMVFEDQIAGQVEFKQYNEQANHGYSLSASLWGEAGAQKLSIW